MTANSFIDTYLKIMQILGGVILPLLGPGVDLAEASVSSLTLAGSMRGTVEL